MKIDSSASFHTGVAEFVDEKKLSEKVSEQPSEGGSGRYEGPKWGENDLLGGLSGYATGACEAFRTVSRRKILGSSPPRLLFWYGPACW